MLVADIHNRGGTILGTSRGSQDAAEMVTTLVRHGISVLMVIGGDGTLRGAQEIADAAAGFLACLRQRVDRRGHAVIVVAEGAGQDLIACDGARDVGGDRPATPLQLNRQRRNPVRDTDQCGRRAVVFFINLAVGVARLGHPKSLIAWRKVRM